MKLPLNTEIKNKQNEQKEEKAQQLDKKDPPKI